MLNRATKTRASESFCILVIAMILLSCGPAVAEPLTSIEDILRLDDEAASLRPKFEVEATVYHSVDESYVVFLEQDGYFLSCGNAGMALLPGTRVKAVGTVNPGLAKRAGDLQSMHAIGLAELQQPLPVRLDELNLGAFDCDWVSLLAKVETVRISYSKTILTCQQGKTRFAVECPVVLGIDTAGKLIDSTVKLTGILDWQLGEPRSPSGFKIYCDPDKITVDEPADNPLHCPPVRSVFDLWKGLDDAFRLDGQITWFDEGNGMVVETSKSGSWIHLDRDFDLSTGCMVRVVGRRDVDSRDLRARVVKEVDVRELSQPEEVAVRELMSEDAESTRVRVRGKYLSSRVTKSGYLVLNMASGNTGYEIWVPNDEDRIDSLNLATAAEVSAAGVVTFNPQTETMFFRILSASFEDLIVTDRNAAWSNHAIRIFFVVGITILALLLTWGAWLRRKVYEGEKNYQNVAAELQHACNTVREGMIVLGPDNRVQFSNQQAEDALAIQIDAGMKSDELIRRLEFPTEKEGAEFTRLWQRVQDDTAVSGECRIEVIGGGDTKLIDVFTSPVMNQDAEYINRLWTFRDVTEKEELQQSLIHLQRQEAVRGLASGFAHDFNNLLQGIQGNLMVAMVQPDRPMEELREPLQAAVGAAERAAFLVKQLLSFSRKSRLQAYNCSVNDVLLRMNQLLQPTLKDTIHVCWDLEDDLPPVYADSRQLEQVFLNICINARDAMSGEGQLTISTYLQPLDGGANAERETYCVISIRDTGCGISKEDKARLFEPFFTTKGTHGTGLGLAMCDGIISQHGGYIEVNSTLGVGTEFRIYLPESKKSTQTDSPNQPEVEATSAGDLSLDVQGMTCLVVDDEDSVRTSLAKFLEASGANVEVAANGAEAISLLDSLDTVSATTCPFDFALLDWSMPVMGGKETLQAMKSRYPHLPIIVCSGQTLEFDEVMLDNGGGADGFMQKPFRWDEISGVIAGILGNTGRTQNATADRVNAS